MFDNINHSQKDNQGGTNQAYNQPTGGNPAGQGFQPASPGIQPPAGIADMFADTEKPPKPEIFQPKPKTEPAAGNYQNFDNIPPELIAGESKAQKIFSLLMVIIGIAVLGMGGYWGYKYYKNNFAAGTNEPIVNEAENINQEADKTGTADNENNAADETDKTANEAPAETTAPVEDVNNEAVNATSPEETIATTVPAVKTDTDQDGLTDEEETGLGTNLNNVDSDADGLFDLEEVRTYKTNPINPDSDADGYSDGEEVKGGYNPNGDGKLYDLNQVP